jgi:hypothetical protein
VATDTKVHPEWLSKKSSQTVRGKDADSEDPMKKYIVGDTMKQNIPKSDAKSVTVQNVDDDQVEMAIPLSTLNSCFIGRQDTGVRFTKARTYRAQARSLDAVPSFHNMGSAC